MMKSDKNQSKNTADADLPIAAIIPEAPEAPVIEPLYRGDSRAPSQIHAEGFKARGHDIDLVNHTLVPRGDYSSLDSAYVSTSSSKKVASSFPKDIFGAPAQSFIYEIFTDRPTVDIIAELKPLVDNKTISYADYKAIALLEKEKAFIGEIKPKEINGHWIVDYTPKKTPPYSKADLLWGLEYNKIIQKEFIINPNYVPPVSIRAHNLWTVGKAASRGLTAVGLALDGKSLVDNYLISQQTGDYHNTWREGTRIVSGWSGAAITAPLFAKMGAILCAPAGPYGVAACTIGGGLAGSITGYFVGSELATKVYDIRHSDSYPITPMTFAPKTTYKWSFFSEANANDYVNDVVITPSIIDKLSSSKPAKVNKPKILTSATITQPDYIEPTPDDAKKAMLTLEHDLQKLIQVWSNEDNSIQEYEESSSVASLVETLTTAQQTNAPIDEINHYSRALKDAKFCEQAKRLDFDNTLQTAEGLVNLATAASLFSNNPKLANQIMTGGKALITIGTQIGALAGFGTLAACVNPVAAAGMIAMSCFSLCSLFDDEGNSASEVIMESLQELKTMVENLRKEMHERFDIIETKLEELHQNLSYRLDEIHLQNEDTQFLIKKAAADNQNAHQLTHQFLDNVQKKINDLYTHTHEEYITSALHAVTDPIRQCLNNIQTRPDVEQYAKWLAEFQLFFEQSAYSAALSGNADDIDDQQTSTWNLAHKVSTEASFHINPLVKYLGKSLEDFNAKKTRPNTLLWAYPSLAILRLIFLTNNSEQASIRRNEFNILDTIAQKAIDIQQFYKDIKNPEALTLLVDEYYAAMKIVAAEISNQLNKLNKNQNDLFNQELQIRYKNTWLEQSMRVSALNITMKMDYPGWFGDWGEGHNYGYCAGHGKTALSQARSSYIAGRNALLNTIKQQHAYPAYINQPGILLGDSKDKPVDIKINLSQIPQYCLLPETAGEPVLNLRSADGGIDISGLMTISTSCAQAEFLGIGHLDYYYQVTDNDLLITAYLVMESERYPVKQISCLFNIGPYNKQEGNLWGWIGITNVSQLRHTIRGVGSTGEAKHWYIEYANIPQINCSDAGPMKSLMNPEQPNARSIQTIDNPIHEQNEILIAAAVAKKSADIFAQYEATIVTEAGGNNALSRSLTHLEACWQRLHAYMMLATPDSYTDKDKRLEFLFNKEAGYYSKKAIIDTLLDNSNDSHPMRTPNNLKLLASTLDDALKQPLLALLQENQDKTNDSLFDVVYTQIMQARDLYSQRIDESGTYKDIFEENTKTREQFEQATQLLNVMAESVASHVSPEVMQQILMTIQANLSQKNTGLCFNNESHSSRDAGLLSPAQKGLQRFGLMPPKKSSDASLLPDNSDSNTCN